MAAAYLACGKLAPEHEGIDLGVGGATVSAAIEEATGTTRSRMRALYKQLGDLGDVAQACRRNQVSACGLSGKQCFARRLLLCETCQHDLLNAVQHRNDQSGMHQQLSWDQL